MGYLIGAVYLSVVFFVASVAYLNAKRAQMRRNEIETDLWINDIEIMLMSNVENTEYKEW